MESPDRTKKDLLNLLLQFRERPPSDPARPQWEAFDAYVLGLVNGGGWTRKQVYQCMIEIAKEHRDSLPENSFDALDGYIDSLTGDVAPECFARFPGEPKDDKEFVAYVRGKKWLRD